MKHIWNIFTDKLGLTVFHPQFTMLSFTNKGVEEGIANSKGRLLDIGCGRMPYKPSFDSLVDDYIGLDHPNTSKLYKNSPHSPSVYADAHKLPFKTNYFDIVLLMQVLEYLENPHKAISEIKRVLKPGGVLVLSSPYLYPIHDGELDLQRFSPSALKMLLKKEKLKVSKFIVQGGFWDFWIQDFLVFYFKRAMELSRGSLLSKTGGLIMLLLGLIFTPFLNSLILLFRRLSLLMPRYENNFPLNIVVVAKK